MSDSDSAREPRPVPVTGGSRDDDTFVRLARLRSEFAALYPGLDAGAWYPAASVAAYFHSWLARHTGRAGGGPPMRGLETAHFEFRGGIPREDPWLPGRSPDERQAAGES